MLWIVKKNTKLQKEETSWGESPYLNTRIGTKNKEKVSKGTSSVRVFNEVREPPRKCRRVPAYP
jgi:hypothetical protein